jgi:DNA-binding CsgD family transcriptional regulator
VGLHHTANTLTATERRIAELVGSGRSNQETAAELFMSVKTVEANLTRIYRKLSVRSRTQLANRMNTLDS